MNLDEANKFWFEFQPIQGVIFGLNDSVRIFTGENAGNYGVVISLMSLEPVSYLVELSSSPFGDVVVLETELESAE